jgi:hypothetical protein
MFKRSPISLTPPLIEIGMAKSIYKPLGEYLTNQTDPVVRMTFAEIERVLGRATATVSSEAFGLVGQ